VAHRLAHSQGSGLELLDIGVSGNVSANGSLVNCSGKGECVPVAGEDSTHDGGVCGKVGERVVCV
jgi:hypothetical protein